MSVRGIIEGKTTQDIADEMATDVISGGIRGVQLTADVAKDIKCSHDDRPHGHAGHEQAGEAGGL